MKKMWGQTQFFFIQGNGIDSSGSWSDTVVWFFSSFFLKIFEQFVKTRIREEYKEKKNKLLLAKEEFKKLLEESKLSPRYVTSWLGSYLRILIVKMLFWLRLYWLAMTCSDSPDLQCNSLHVCSEVRPIDFWRDLFLVCVWIELPS